MTLPGYGTFTGNDAQLRSGLDLMQFTNAGEIMRYATGAPMSVTDYALFVRRLIFSFGSRLIEPPDGDGFSSPSACIRECEFHILLIRSYLIADPR